MQRPCEDFLLVIAETKVHNDQLMKHNKYLEDKLRRDRRYTYLFIALTIFWMLKYFLS
ncbi:hypothetical protein HOBO_250 [Bacillus phage Hobo]|uniref:Uncharacterized protein n=2 Tax=Caeruleovirus BM15 TaxID=1985178 RepID=A0A0S2MUU6_9CAUD|nr:hypothetical protein FD732_gp091 [Bacillus phage BM15]ALO79658.1 hypothetical protein BM10_254 [Bacillus phage BM15]AXQ67005.1 hypothetical protein HOBO_250 [Bacillus phage Hobo]